MTPRRWKSSFVVVLAGSCFSAGVLARPSISAWKTEIMARIKGETATTRLRANPHYFHKLSQFEMLGARPVVLLGDSRVDGIDWSELLRRSDVSNRGIAGDTTDGVLQRLRQSVPNDVSVCVLQVGLNDLAAGVPVDRVVAHYRQIIADLVTRVHARVVVTSIILVSENSSRLNEAITHCNRALQNLAGEQALTFLDLNAALCPEGHLPPKYSADGAHLNGNGYKVWGETLALHLPPGAERPEVR